LTYLTVLLLNIISIALYYVLAIRFKIIDQPNERSSHDYITVRGAGVIFLITGLFWALSSTGQHLYIIIGLTSIGLISLLDDIFTLPNNLRFVIHVLSVLLVFLDIGLFSSSIIIILIVLILYLGWINAFNFMDGINGITSFYSISILLPLFLAFRENYPAYTSLVLFLNISVVVFMTLNIRSRALAFCGDVGAIVLAYIIGFLVITLIISTGNIEFILFGSVYGIDTIFTIIRRLLRRENIFQPHRTHLYQLLVNNLQWHFLSVSLLYSLIQLMISLLVLKSIQMIPQYSMLIAVLIILLISTIYLYALKLVVARGGGDHQNHQNL
jgi:UDP-GlcNAc:undecaprenyl-phosphate/decaprenyl-phosphate GlcNAc-1-phosphate transferase